MTRYELFHRRIAPIAFVCAILGIAYDNCDKEERTRATFVLDFGSAADDVRAVEAEVWIGGEPVAQFRRKALEGGRIGTAKFDGSLPAPDGELRVDVELGAGERRKVTRKVHIEDGATITIPLERDLR